AAPCLQQAGERQARNIRHQSTFNHDRTRSCHGGMVDMLAPSSDLLRAGLGLKLNQIKLAMRSYLRDRTSQATGTVTSYAVAAGLFAAAGVFLIAACLVGVTALFRWVEINYGLFHAFGIVGALLLLIAAICAAFAALKLKRPAPRFPSLTSRLRVAIKANPANPDQLKAVRDTAAGILLARSAPLPRAERSRLTPRSARNSRDIRAGLILMATLLGWAAVRRRQQARQTYDR
ncbi:MAG: phage holin family protein, partial [Bradyrhizobium sp.]